MYRRADVNCYHINVNGNRKRSYVTRPIAIFFIAAIVGIIPMRITAEEEDEWRVPVTLGADGWMYYENARFGTAFPVPPGMKALRPPDNGGGQAFASIDGKITLTGGGSFNVNEDPTIESSWKYAVKVPDRTITYQVKKDNWYVISGTTKDGKGFYEKFIINKKYQAGWSMTYPLADEKKCSLWIERIAKGFDPRFGKGHDRVE